MTFKIVDLQLNLNARFCLAGLERKNRKYQILLGLVLILVSSPLLIYTNCGNINDVSQESVSLDPTQNNLSDPACLNNSSNPPAGCVSLIATGGGRTCAVVNGGVKCWGALLNANGSINNVATPQQVPNLSGVTAISMAANLTCVVANGGVQCWGDNMWGQLGNATSGNFSATPVVVKNANGTPLTGVSSISVGGAHACALTGSTAKCWGFNQFGQLGTNNITNSNVAKAVVGLSNLTSISAGLMKTCALTSLNKVKCWGSNANGELGAGSAALYSLTPLTVSNLNNAIAVDAMSDAHACAITNTNTVKCWGSNDSGQLGTGTSIPNSNVAVAVVGLSNAVSINVGARHSCAIQASGQMKCWGFNLRGQLGNGATSPTPSPTPSVVLNVSNAATMDAGSNHTCSIENGFVKCWGNNPNGELGNGTIGGILSTPPIGSGGVIGLQVVSLIGGDDFFCALMNGGIVKCWGSNSSGQLGYGIMGGSSTTPVTVSNLTNVIMASGGQLHTCAVLGNGQVWCWGDNTYGQLGNGTSVNSPIPVQVNGISNAIKVAAGDNHTCALLANGQVWCWGFNGAKQLGIINPAGSNVPVQVVGITTAIDVSAGWVNSCVVLANGQVKCWGNNSQGNLGNGVVVPCNNIMNATATPTTVVGIANAASIEVDMSACAKLTTGEIKCWGDNPNGQLGNGTIGGCSSTPNLVTGISNATSITGDDITFCSLLTTGQIQCWGGLGLWPNPTLPVTMPVSNATSVAITDGVGVPTINGVGNKCALTQCSVQCWANPADPVITIQGL